MRQADQDLRGAQAATLFSRQTDGKPYAETLSTLVNHDMAAAQDDLRALNTTAQSGLPGLLAGLETRQARILTGLLSLLGQIADARTTPLNPLAEGKNSRQPPATGEAQARAWMDELKNFVAD